jgi:AmiR/NasT family two-component response regulator
VAEHTIVRMDMTPRIVVAEDESIIRMDIVESLRDLGCDVVGEAGDGETALALVRGLIPDVALLDIQMPIMDGLQVAQQILDEGICAVVMVTAFSQQSLVTRAAEAGAMGYLVKPIHTVELMPAITVARTAFVRAQSLRQDVATLADQLATRKSVERAKSALQQRLGIDEAAAFRWLQKAAMDQRTSMRAVADRVLASGAQN